MREKKKEKILSIMQQSFSRISRTNANNDHDHP